MTGDPLADVLLATRERLPGRQVEGPYVLATVHRNYNTDDPARLRAVLGCLGAAPLPVVLPRAPADAGSGSPTAGLTPPANVSLREPVTYSEMLALERDADRRSPPTRAGSSARPTCGASRASRCARRRSGSRPSQTGWNTLVGADPDAFRAAFEKPAPTPVPRSSATATQRCASPS